MMIWPHCNLGRRWTRLSPAPRVAAASRNTPARRCSLRFIAGAAASQVIGDRSKCAHLNPREALSSRSLEVAVEEITRRVIGRQPILVQQKIVHVIRENQLFDLNALLAEPSDEIHRLGEIDVAVV